MGRNKSTHFPKYDFFPIKHCYRLPFYMAEIGTMWTPSELSIRHTLEVLKCGSQKLWDENLGWGLGMRLDCSYNAYDKFCMLSYYWDFGKSASFCNHSAG